MEWNTRDVHMKLFTFWHDQRSYGGGLQGEKKKELFGKNDWHYFSNKNNEINWSVIFAVKVDPV